jgi:hypothetical protein
VHYIATVIRVMRGDRWRPSRARRSAGVVPSCGRFYKLESESSAVLTWCLNGGTVELEKCVVAHVSSRVSACRKMGHMQTFIAWFLFLLPKRGLQRLRYNPSALKVHYIFLSLSCSCLRLLPRHLFLSSFPSIKHFRMRCVHARVCLNAWEGTN